MQSDTDRRPLERRRHPDYARRTAAVTYGLVFGGLACLMLGVAVRNTAWRNLETICNIGFCGALVAAGLHWFRRGESTTCPQCGRSLTVDAPPTRTEPVSFVCRDCEIQWVSRVD